MTDHALASFEAKDGTGRWEVFTWGIIANGQRYHFTKQSHIVCAGLPGRTEKHVYQTEEDDGFGLWAALAVYQETGSLADAGLAAWALGGPSIETHIDTREIPGRSPSDTCAAAATPTSPCATARTAAGFKSVPSNTSPTSPLPPSTPTAQARYRSAAVQGLRIFTKMQGEESKKCRNRRCEDVKKCNGVFELQATASYQSISSYTRP